ncbi:uncharacterized protein LOC130720289 [Lotus japonicus]|uniref:uncharacterized protein LOC130710602 n=1 Tax=Lotus japonicus TaxID=34305 RepID=UPI0025899B3C|nr:uncharacterized protein LOC130710602 [Lotus japonicus]XP_057426900.1 uncharacterized protein LOC130720289 [Lotus japonicus]
MLQTGLYPPDYLNGLAQHFGEWEVVEARGIPDCGRSDLSALWVISWLDMDIYFKPNVVGVLKERPVRMGVAMQVLMGDHNECKDELGANAERYWHDMIFSNTA